MVGLISAAYSACATQLRVSQKRRNSVEPFTTLRPIWPAQKSSLKTCRTDSKIGPTTSNGPSTSIINILKKILKTYILLVFIPQVQSLLEFNAASGNSFIPQNRIQFSVVATACEGTFSFTFSFSSSKHPKYFFSANASGRCFPEMHGSKIKSSFYSRYYAEACTSGGAHLCNFAPA